MDRQRPWRCEAPAARSRGLSKCWLVRASSERRVGSHAHDSHVDDLRTGERGSGRGLHRKLAGTGTEVDDGGVSVEVSNVEPSGCALHFESARKARDADEIKRCEVHASAAGPAGPCGACGPCGPGGPCRPCRPCGPVGPAGPAPAISMSNWGGWLVVVDSLESRMTEVEGLDAAAATRKPLSAARSPSL